MENIYPLKFKPVYKNYIWGGSRIPRIYHRNVPDGIYAESWEISDRDDGMSVVTNGPLAGGTLRDILSEYGKSILGTAVGGTRFPLLFKLIDSKQKLSVQVHPNDDNAAACNGEAKTEMWYMLDDGQVYCGLNEGVTRERFLQAVENGTSGEMLRKVPLKKGEAVFVPGGRVHAIDGGCLILEIQQNSNTTYRLYDWGRLGTDGKPRELHIDKAIQVINWNDHENPKVTPVLLTDEEDFQRLKILKCRYFLLEELRFKRTVEIPMSGKTFHALFTTEGEAEILWDGGTETAPAGTSVLIPSDIGHYALRGSATVLRTSIP